MESDARFFKRRASEELAAADRAITSAARDRRLHLAAVFLQRLENSEDATFTSSRNRAVSWSSVRHPQREEA
jgi:hypothetical protein